MSDSVDVFILRLEITIKEIKDIKMNKEQVFFGFVKAMFNNLFIVNYQLYY